MDTAVDIPAAAASPRPAEPPAAGLRAQLRPLRSPLALPAGAAALVAGAAHVPVIPQHLQEVPYVGRLFVALVVACVAGALVLALRDVAAAYAGLGAAALASVALYLVSRGPGMPGMADDVGDWGNSLGLISVASESLLVMLAVAALALALRGRRRLVVVALVPVGGLVLAAAGLASGL